MSASPVYIIGPGHGGCALAFDMTSRGHDVTLLGTPGHLGNIPKIRNNNNELECSGIINGRHPIKTGQDLTLIPNASPSTIIVATPSQGHEEVLGALAAIDLSQSLVVFITSNAFGIQARRVLNARAVLDAATSPYSSRLTPDGAITIRGIKSRLQIGPLVGESDAGQISSVFGVPLKWSGSSLEIFLSALNGVTHVPTALLNLGWIEATNGDFFFYRQGMSSGVCSIIEAADRERLAVAAAYGCSVISALDTFNTNYGLREKTMHDFATRTEAHNRTKGAQKRFLSQDVPFWLVLCAELGARARVPTPVMDMLILLTSTLTAVDHSKTGRTLASLGLGDASVDEVASVCRGRRAETGHVKDVKPSVLRLLPIHAE